MPMVGASGSLELDVNSDTSYTCDLHVYGRCFKLITPGEEVGDTDGRLIGEEVSDTDGGHFKLIRPQASEIRDHRCRQVAD